MSNSVWDPLQICMFNKITTKIISLFKQSHAVFCYVCITYSYTNIHLPPKFVCLFLINVFHDNIKATDLSFLHTFLFLNEEILFTI